MNTTPHDGDGSPHNNDVDAPKDETLSLFPNSAFETNLRNFDTPPKEKPQDSVLTSSRSGSRFDLKERNADLPMDEARADDEEHSPTLVLKRLQQRKARQISPAPNTSDGKAGLSINEEMKKLDAIANGISSSREKRRTVKQPISYAEPSLNSKLRRGDIFFQKENVDDKANDNPLKDRQTNKGITAHMESR